MRGATTSAPVGDGRSLIWYRRTAIHENGRRSMAETILTRRVLYDLVWSKPMIKVAEELGLSDVGLKKVCTKHRVPTPTRGYWAKKNAGKPVKQTRFYETADPQDERIVIRGQHNQLPEPVRAAVEQERARRKPRALVPLLE